MASESTTTVVSDHSTNPEKAASFDTTLKESMEVKIAKGEETLADMIEQITEEKLVLTNVETQVDTTGDGNADDKERELIAANVVGGMSKEGVAESGKVELESEGKNVKTEEEKKVIIEESDELKTIEEAEAVSSSITSTEVSEKSFEGDSTSRDIEEIAENEKESKEDEVTTTIKELIEEPKKTETEEKGEETEQTCAKPDFLTPESTNDGKDTKTSEEPPKEEVSAKPSAQQSNNIMAKVKQSLAKAKKAITGKSPNSKMVSSETKSEVEDK